MSRRNQIYVTDKIQAEEILDEQLKDAGLWEEGLTSIEKQQLLELIKDSENSAKEDEIKRREKQRSEGQTSSTVTPTKTPEKSRESLSPVIEDSDPVITFESPSTANRRRALNSSVITVKEVANENNQDKNVITNEKENSANSVINYTSPPPCKRTLKQIKSLFSKKSITVKCISPSSKVPMNISKDVVVSETDEDSDENVDSLAVDEKTSDKSKSSEKEGSQTTLGQTSSHEIVSLQPNKSSHSEEDEEHHSFSTNSNKYTLKSPAIKKAIFSTTCNQNSRKESPQLGSSSDVKGKKLLNIESSSQNISDVDSPEVINSDVTNKGTLSNHNNKDIGNKKAKVDFFIPNSLEDVPLKKKFTLLSEKQCQAYFRAPYETETKCVKRIYSLITDWHSALAEYQKGLPNPRKWGPPISVDRQLKIGLLRKNCISHIAKENKRPSSLEISDPSSDSETQVSDQSDEDFVIFQKKKKIILQKPKNLTSIKQKPTNSNPKKLSDMDCEESKDHFMTQGGKKQEPKDSEREMVPSSISDSKNLNEIDSPLEEKNKPYSQDILSNDPDPSKIVQTTFYSKKTTRKTFELSQDSNFEPIPRKESKSPELFDSQSTSLPEEANINQNDVIDDITLCSSSSSEEAAQSSLASSDVKMKSLRRSCIKRKNSPTPLNMPPMKKAATDNQSDIQMECEIRPPSLRLRRFLTKKTGSETPTDNISRSQTQEAPVKEALKSILEATVTEHEGESISEQPKPVTPQTDASPETNEKNEASTSKSEVSVECPLCQTMFSFREIEAHASECNGPLEATAQSQTSSLRRRQPKGNSEQQAEVLYLETHKQASNSKR